MMAIEKAWEAVEMLQRTRLRPAPPCETGNRSCQVLSRKHVEIQLAFAWRHFQNLAFTPVVGQGKLVDVLVELPLPRLQLAQKVIGHVKKAGEFMSAYRTRELQPDLSLRVCLRQPSGDLLHQCRRPIFGQRCRVLLMAVFALNRLDAADQQLRRRLVRNTVAGADCRFYIRAGGNTEVHAKPGVIAAKKLLIALLWDCCYGNEQVRNL